LNIGKITKLEIYFHDDIEKHQKCLKKILEIIEDEAKRVHFDMHFMTEDECEQFYKKRLKIMKKADEINKSRMNKYCPQCKEKLIMQGVDKEINSNILKCEKCQILYLG